MATTAKHHKRANGEGSIRQRASGIWEARYSYIDRDGKLGRDSVYGKTQREALNRRAAKLREIARRGAPIVQRQTVAQFLERWLDDAVKPNKAYKTYISYEGTVRLHIIPTLGHLQLTKLTAQHVQALVRQKSDAGLSPRSVQYIATVLRIALNKALKWELVSTNVVTAIDVPRDRRPEVRPLSDEQARRFLQVLRGDRLEALYIAAMTSGLRQGELLGLTWDDVDLDRGLIQVRRQLQRVNGAQCLRDVKTAKSRRAVAIPAMTVAALETHHRRQLEERLAAGEAWHDWDLVFMTPLGTPLEPSGILKHFKRRLAEAGLPSQRFHDLRHLFACLLLLGNTHPKVVQELLGHTQIGTTMDIYAHVMPALHRAAADSVGAIFAAAP